MCLENRFKDDSGEGDTLSVNALRKVSKVWYNKKSNGPVRHYEVGGVIKTGDMCWLHGPFPCG